MDQSPCILILGGTAEAAQLAREASRLLAGRARVVTALAGATPTAPALPGEVRVGPFASGLELEAYIRAIGARAVVDATHPFATTISTQAFDACLMAEVPRLLLLRPPWRMEAGDRYVEVPDFEQAARDLPRIARRAFLTVGSKNLRAFSEVRGVWFLVRLLKEPAQPPPLESCLVVAGRPPFTVEQERNLLTRHRIEILVSKQSGGTAGLAKIQAARSLRLPILFVARPPREPGDTVATVAEALRWVATHA